MGSVGERWEAACEEMEGEGKEDSMRKRRHEEGEGTAQERYRLFGENRGQKSVLRASMRRFSFINLEDTMEKAKYTK